MSQNLCDGNCNKQQFRSTCTVCSASSSINTGPCDNTGSNAQRRGQMKYVDVTSDWSQWSLLYHHVNFSVRLLDYILEWNRSCATSGLDHVLLKVTGTGMQGAFFGTRSLVRTPLPLFLLVFPM